MKKFALIAYAALMILTLCACTESCLSYYEMGLKVCEVMGEMASETDYVRIFSEDAEIMEIMRKIGKGDYDDPDGVYSIEFDPEDMAEAMESELDDLPSSLRGIAEKKVYAAIGNAMNNTMGVNMVAAASIANHSMAFATAEEPEAALYMYVFDELPVLVSFTPGEGNTALASGMFFMPGLTENHDFDSKRDIEDLFEDMLDISVNVSKTEE